MAQEWELAKLYSGEEKNDPSIIGSVAAGIATGLIRIPQGAASLFASIYDITNDTDTATEVEEWFDKNIYSNLGRRESRSNHSRKNNSSVSKHWYPGRNCLSSRNQASHSCNQECKGRKIFYP